MRIGLLTPPVRQKSSKKKMKFGKEFVSQMVPEWQGAYMDYIYLKKILNGVLRYRPQSPTADSSQKSLRKVSLYRAFSGLTNRYKGYSSPKKNDDEVILINEVDDEGLEGYQTMFLKSLDEGGEIELMFFKRLDGEFNKVLKFYRAKVDGLMEEADELSKQMDALIALRIKVEKPVVHFGDSTSLELEPNSVDEMKVIHEVEMSGESMDDRRKVHVSKNFDSASLEILDHVKISVTPETPRSTLKVFLSNTKSNAKFSKDDLKKAEELLTRAFVEFYHRLRLLKSYCFLNQLAFSKIMKKYDKICRRNASKLYLKMVDNSYLGSSDEVTKLIDRVEATFTKHFANGNHRKGMEILRPKAKKERHRISFLIGLLLGCLIALMVAIGVLAHARDVLKSEGRGKYMENIFPLYAFFGFIVLHMIMYSANIYFWRQYRINYQFIFGFKQGTELGYREALLLSSGLALLTLGGVISNLDMEMDPRTESFSAITELVPLGLMLVVLLITFCPFNIMYRSSRFFFIRCTFRCLCAPLYQVTLPDFFLADQLTSQVQAFRCLEFYICYYAWGDFKRRSSKCREHEIFQSFYFVVAIVPYWLRFLQCLRRLFEEKDLNNILNGLKYLSTIVAVAFRTSYDLNRGNTYLIMAAASSGVATLANTYWDIMVDWGLMQRGSRNPWLRDKLLVSNKSVYFIAMVLNVLLRLAWMQSVLGFRQTPFLHRKAMIAIVASLEIIRRGIWNFFRLENEHLNNVGKYRAFKSVPLPFNYDDEDKSI